jgi:hypothetical protein
MLKKRPRMPSPALVLSALALFFAVGGSAYALGTAKAPPAQTRCQNGAVRGFAIITGNPTQGLQNAPQDFSTDASLFGAKFNCTGGVVEMRRLPGNTGYAVRFRGITSKVATANVLGDTAGSATVNALPDGSFQIVTAGNQIGGSDNTSGQFNRRLDLQFVVVVY